LHAHHVHVDLHACYCHGCSRVAVMAADMPQSWLKACCSQAAVMTQSWLQSCCGHTAVKLQSCHAVVMAAGMLHSCYCQGYSHVHGVELHAHQCILVCVMLPCTDMCMLVYIVLTCMYTMCMLMYMVVQCMHTMCMLIYMHMSCMHTNVLVCVTLQCMHTTGVHGAAMHSHRRACTSRNGLCWHVARLHVPYCLYTRYNMYHMHSLFTGGVGGGGHFRPSKFEGSYWPFNGCPSSTGSTTTSIIHRPRDFPSYSHLTIGYIGAR